jgi:uncharacterized protein (AIM24 family)
MTTTESSTSTYTCPYCRLTSQLDGLSCLRCGAPVDVRATVSGGGWVTQPPIVDMARLQFGQSKAQISGSLVPVADIELAAGDSIYFSHHVLLFFDPTVTLANVPAKGDYIRMVRAGMPMYLLRATGPGHIALSFDLPGETIAVPLESEQAVLVREGHLLAATDNVIYDYEQSHVYAVTSPKDAKWERNYHYPVGQYIDWFKATNGPGLLLLHAPGDVMNHDLDEGQSITIQPRSLIYKDISVGMKMHREIPSGDYRPWHFWLKLTGPGRIAMSSKYQYFGVPGWHCEDESSAYTWRNW